VNPAFENVTSLITGNILTILVVVVGMTALSIVAGRAVGKTDKRKRRVVTNLTFYGGMIVLALFVVPQILGARG
jgi:predicted permease